MTTVDLPPNTLKHFDFSIYAPSSRTQFDIVYAIDQKRQHDLYQFIVDFYKNNDLDYESYYDMINAAIKHNNIEGLDILWRGITYHDRDHPDYVGALVVAVECSNLSMVKHVFHAFMHNIKFDEICIEYSTLKALAVKNTSDVIEFVDGLKELVDEDGIILGT